MLIKKAIGFASVAALLGTVFACSSSTSTGTPAGDAAGTVKPVVDASTDRGTPITPVTDSAPPAPACTATDAAGFTPVDYHSPRKIVGACTDAQIAKFANDCFGATGSEAACTAWLGDAGNKNCNTCISTDSADAAWGAVVDNSLNLGGCVELGATDKTCGKKLTDGRDCVLFTCDENAGGNCEGATTAQFNACVAASSKAGCKSYWDPYVACQTAEKANPCLAGAAADRVKTVVTVFCGAATTGDASTGG